MRGAAGRAVAAALPGFEFSPDPEPASSAVSVESRDIRGTTDRLASTRSELGTVQRSGRWIRCRRNLAGLARAGASLAVRGCTCHGAPDETAIHC